MSKGRVKAHRRRTKGGKVTQVQEHARRGKPKTEKPTTKKKLKKPIENIPYSAKAIDLFLESAGKNHYIRHYFYALERGYDRKRLHAAAIRDKYVIHAYKTAYEEVKETERRIKAGIPLWGEWMTPAEIKKVKTAIKKIGKKNNVGEAEKIYNWDAEKKEIAIVWPSMMRYVISTDELLAIAKGKKNAR